MDDSFVEVVELYVERASILLESLADSLAEHDRQQVRIAAHTLKGSSGLVGAEHLSQLAGSIEAADGDVPLEGLVGAVVAEFGRVEAALRELVPGLAARPQGE